MEALLWALRSRDGFTLAWPIAFNLAICLALTETDFLLLIVRFYARLAFFGRERFRPGAPGTRPSGLVIIPSLLRGRDDLDAITTTVESCATNGYPSELLVVASVDGRTEHPALYAELCAWVASRSYPKNVRVYVTGTETRLGKMMAVEAGVTFVKELVARGEVASFPAIYFSVDGDGTLGERALELLAARLTTPHPITGNLRRIVSGKICIRPDLFWKGWRALFTVEGHIYIQVAREFLVSNVARHNWKLTPKIGVPGALYCTWGELLVAAPHYMGFMQTLRFSDGLKWWLGVAPPAFSKSTAPPLPEALTGASDDTCIAFLASIASWRGGKLTWDAPRTPLHAFAALLWGYFVERSHDYEPEARVFTYTPSTIKGLWKQRVRWNASRFECAGRFWRAFWFHWEIGLPVGAHLALVVRVVLEMTVYYVLLPYYWFGSSNVLVAYVIGYAGQTLAYALYTLMALAIERDFRRYWRVLYCLPLASLHCITINFFGCVVGVTKDLLLFGNTTNFAPEWTLMKGRCERVAILFRARRLLALSVRALVHGDVPLGRFWIGWRETAWTPSGFEGWTTGKKPRAIVPRPSLRALFAALRRRREPPATTSTPAEVTAREGVRGGARVYSLPPPRASVPAQRKAA